VPFYPVHLQFLHFLPGSPDCGYIFPSVFQVELEYAQVLPEAQFRRVGAVIDIQQVGKTFQLQVGKQPAQGFLDRALPSFAAVDNEVAVQVVIWFDYQAALSLLRLEKGDIHGWHGPEIAPVEVIDDVYPEQRLEQ
jgi:hypothetical protein